MKFLVILLSLKLAAQTKDNLLENEKKVRDQMIVISRQLGVSCKECHNLDNFKSDEKIEFKIAKEHMRVVNLLNDKGFRGTPKADCYMCHRGQMKPAYKEPVKSQ